MNLESALPIIKALADGVNPITSEAYSEELLRASVFGEPRVLRALFIAVDLMQREVDRERRKARLPANFGKSWDEIEDKALAAAFEAGKPIREMAAALQRTESSVRLRLEKLGKITRATP